MVIQRNCCHDGGSETGMAISIVNEKVSDVLVSDGRPTAYVQSLAVLTTLSRWLGAIKVFRLARVGVTNNVELCFE